MGTRLADLVRKARRLAAERDRLIEGVAQEWTRALQSRRLSPADLDELWASLVEDIVRRGTASPARKGISEEWRRETHEVITRIREKVEGALRDR